MTTTPTPLPPIERPSVVLWDMDGTLVESGPVIVASLREVLRRMDLPGGEVVARDVVGPPLRHNLASVGVPVERLEDSVGLYHDVYVERAHEAPVYPGVREALERLRAAGVVQGVATSKTARTARAQLTDLGLSEFFTVICGSDPADARSADKSRIVAEALDLLRTDGHADVAPGHAAGVVMVGDRHHDVTGARANGVPTIAARWGYGNEEEWSTAAAGADSPADVAGLLGF